jgi:hypothetical protein
MMIQSLGRIHRPQRTSEIEATRATNMDASVRPTTPAKPGLLEQNVPEASIFGPLQT